MTGSRGYLCSDGPLAGVVLMVTDQTEPGTMWNALGPDGAVYLYEFRGDHFNYSGPTIPANDDLSDGWAG